MIHFSMSFIKRTSGTESSNGEIVQSSSARRTPIALQTHQIDSNRVGTTLKRVIRAFCQ